MTDPAEPSSSCVRTSLRTIAEFLIGTVAGSASVFLPWMMLLLSIDTEPAPQRSISLFQPEFVWLGVVFALTIGVICAILEFAAQHRPRDVFMTAPGIPALLTGVHWSCRGYAELCIAEGTCPRPRP